MTSLYTVSGPYGLPTVRSLFYSVRLKGEVGVRHRGKFSTPLLFRTFSIVNSVARNLYKNFLFRSEHSIPALSS
jgi:hypothetical protein